MTGQTVTIAHCSVAARLAPGAATHARDNALEIITSRRNPIVTRCRDAARTNGPGGPMLLEGRHLVDEALAAELPLELVLVTAETTKDADSAARLHQLERITRVVQVPVPVMAAASPADSPSGLLALADRPAATLEIALAGVTPLVVALVGVQDPGNTGAVIRAAEAGGATGVVTVGGADPFGWKALRGAMGSTLRVPIARTQDIATLSVAASARPLRTLAAVPRGGTPITQADLARPTLLCFGGEGGFDQDTVGEADERISIPMRPPVESLNLAVASALVIYEAARQRSARPVDTR